MTYAPNAFNLKSRTRFTSKTLTTGVPQLGKGSAPPKSLKAIGAGRFLKSLEEDNDRGLGSAVAIF